MAEKPKNPKRYFVLVDGSLDPGRNPFGEPCTLEEAVEYVGREYSDPDEDFNILIVEEVMQTEYVEGKRVLNNISNK